jgi:DNA-binding NarL/FixJ family response regulator
MDIDRTEINHEEVIWFIKQNRPDTRVVGLTMYASSRTASLEAGADEVVLKGSPAEMLKHAILTRNVQIMPGVEKTNNRKVVLQ